MQRFVFHTPFKGAKKPRVTVVGFLNDDNNVVIGVSRCSSSDQFSRSKGREIAEARIISNENVGVIDGGEKPYVNFLRWARRNSPKILNKSHLVHPAPLAVMA